MIKKVFIVHHSHVDIGYTDIQTKIMADHVDFLDQVLDYCRISDNYPEESKFRWTCETSWTVKNYFENRPKRIPEFIKRVKEGRIEVTGLYLNVTELYSAEELIRALYFAKGLEKRHGINVISVMNSDIPGLSWAIPQILAKSGIKYLSMSIDPVRSFRPEVPYPFYWISPDGSKVLTWNTESKKYWYNEGYHLGFGENYQKLIKLLPGYLQYITDEGHPYDAYCIRMGQDNIPPHLEVCKIAEEWNKKHRIPKIIISTNNQFFQYIERKYKDKIPCYRLAWPDWWADGNASAAYETGISRNTHRMLDAVEKLSAILFSLGEAYPEKEIKKIWDNISFFDEHTWGASGSIAKPHSLQTKAQWAIKSSFVYQAAVESQQLLHKNLKSLAGKIKNSKRAKIVIFNPLPYRRDGIVNIPAQLQGKGSGQSETAFPAESVPALGYKTYEIIPANKKSTEFFCLKDSTMENRFYKIVLDPITGGIKSIKDKELSQELVDNKSNYKFNQYIYEEILSVKGRRSLWDVSTFPGTKGLNPKFKRTSPKYCKIKKGKDKPLVGSLIVETKAKGCPKIVQEIILYHNVKRIDIVNTLRKEETLNPEAVYYAFPFNFRKPEIKIEITGAAMRPEIDQLPGTAKDYYSIQDWVSISNKKYGVIWVTKEAPLIQLGEINTGKWITDKLKVKNGTIFSWIMNNYWYTNFRASQSGEVTFHYSITSVKGKVDNAKASIFAQECNNPLIAVALNPNRKGVLPEKENSFLSLNKKNIFLSALKRAEDKNGLIIRLMEIEGKDTVVRITLPFLEIKQVYQTNLVEENQKKISAGKHIIEISVKSFSITTIRMVLSQNKMNGSK